jgi:hypothetical protein
MKEIIFKSVTAIICVAIFSLTLSGSLGKYGEAINKATEIMANVSVGGNTDVGTQDNNYTQDITDNSISDVVTDTVTPDADTDTDAPDTGADATAPDAGQTATDPTAYTKDQAVKFYMKVHTETFPEGKDVKVLLYDLNNTLIQAKNETIGKLFVLNLNFTNLDVIEGVCTLNYWNDQDDDLYLQ